MCFFDTHAGLQRNRSAGLGGAVWGSPWDGQAGMGSRVGGWVWGLLGGCHRRLAGVLVLVVSIRTDRWHTIR